MLFGGHEAKEEDLHDLHYERDSLQRRLIDIEAENQQYQHEWKARNEETEQFEYTFQDLELRYERILKALVELIGEEKANRIAEGGNLNEM